MADSIKLIYKGKNPVQYFPNAKGDDPQAYVTGTWAMYGGVLFVPTEEEAERLLDKYPKYLERDNPPHPDAPPKIATFVPEPPAKTSKKEAK